MSAATMDMMRSTSARAQESAGQIEGPCSGPSPASTKSMIAPDWVSLRPSASSRTGIRPSALKAVRSVVPSRSVSGSPTGMVKTRMPR